MRVEAPGKLLLAGAYAVLDGAPAFVVAVDRVAIADGAHRADRPTPEVLAALSQEEAPDVDASQMRSGAHKLGLGSSAAMLVASLGVAFRREGRDIEASDVREELLTRAQDAHRRVQQGGSGLDVAASVHGGILSYSLIGDRGSERAVLRPSRLPSGVSLDVFWCGVPAVTTNMRALVETLRTRHEATYRLRIGAVAAAARGALAAADVDDLAGFIRATRDGGVGLAALGRAADAPIVPPLALALAAAADAEGAAFVPSGAGGGDVFVYVGGAHASPAFVAAATSRGFTPVPMRVHSRGVHQVDA